MAGNTLNILGTTAAGGSGTSLAWFAPSITAGPVGVAGTDGVQTITVTGTPTGGTVPIQWNGFSTSVAWNATAANVQTALRLLHDGALFTVAGGPGPATPWVVTSPKVMKQAVISNTGASTTLTGGSSPNATTAQTTPGTQTTNPATGLIPAGFVDAGLCEASVGLGVKYSDTTKEIDSFGLSSAARILFTKTVVTFDLTFQETNHTTLEVYHRLPIGATGVADGSGYIAGVVDGPPTIQQYSAIFDIVDGENHFRGYAPIVQNTGKGAMNLPYGDAVTRPVTLTAFPDSSNNAVYWYPVVNALASL